MGKVEVDSKIKHTEGKLTECYTVICDDLVYPGTMLRMELFTDREKMKELLAKYAKQRKRCVVVPGIVDDVSYQIEYETNSKTIKSVVFEDEPEYRIESVNVLNFKKPKDIPTTSQNMTIHVHTNGVEYCTISVRKDSSIEEIIHMAREVVSYQKIVKEVYDPASKIVDIIT
ncbi:MAG: hypothetical protein ACXACY_25490 [Candidatus Hodarchaeales archaeon]|jgi:hypothetical protein